RFDHFSAEPSSARRTAPPRGELAPRTQACIDGAHRIAALIRSANEPAAAGGIGLSGFAELLVRAGNIYVKLSAAYRSAYAAPKTIASDPAARLSFTQISSRIRSTAVG